MLCGCWSECGLALGLKEIGERNYFLGQIPQWDILPAALERRKMNLRFVLSEMVE